MALPGDWQLVPFFLCRSPGRTKFLFVKLKARAPVLELWAVAAALCCWSAKLFISRCILENEICSLSTAMSDLAHSISTFLLLIPLASGSSAETETSHCLPRNASKEFILLSLLVGAVRQESWTIGRTSDHAVELRLNSERSALRLQSSTWQTTSTISMIHSVWGCVDWWLKFTKYLILFKKEFLKLVR